MCSTATEGKAQHTVSVAAALFLRAVPLRVEHVGRNGHRHGTERVGRVQGEIKDMIMTRSIFELGILKNGHATTVSERNDTGRRDVWYSYHE